MTLRVHPDEIVRASNSPLLAAHGSWERVRLGDVASVLNGFAFKSSEFGSSDGMPLIRIRDVGASTTSVRYTGAYDDRYIVLPGTIVVGMDGDFRAARWNGPPALLNQRVCAISVGDRGAYDEDFLLFVLPGYLDAIHGATSSITVKHLSSETIKQLPLPLPPLAEQRRIVAAIEEQLSRLDAALDALKSAAARLDRLEDAALEISFDREWPRVRLGEIGEIVGGVTKNRAAEASPAYVSVPYLRVANVQRGRLELDSLTTIRVAPETAAKLALRPGDVLFNEGGDRDKLGRGWVWSGEVDDCIHQNHVFRARLSDQFEPRFVSWWGNTFGRNWFWDHGRQTTNLASISLSTLKSFPVPAPPIAVQREVVARIEETLAATFRSRLAIRDAQRRGANLRRSILATAFRGELVPQDPDDEPASVLLERIAAERASAPQRPRRARVPARD